MNSKTAITLAEFEAILKERPVIASPRLYGTDIVKTHTHTPIRRLWASSWMVVPIHAEVQTLRGRNSMITLTVRLELPFSRMLSKLRHF